MSEPAPGAKDASGVDRMTHRLHTPGGRTVYATRKCTVEPTFGIITSALVCTGWNLKRLHTLRLAA
ncbi:MAG TPA: hypothetical protein VF515_02940 [Candidatus Binatia bacterium]